MVVDSSALISILLGEPEADAFAEALARPERRFMSAFNWLEASMVIEARKGLPGARLFNELASGCGIEVMPFDAGQAEVALDAWRRFGKGRHEAGLNMGDCAAYALARTMNQGLLFKGDDFLLTDVAQVV
jgi:ribonuclease VapC